MVSVPSFGDSFFIFSVPSAMKWTAGGNSFRPLIRGFFFYHCYCLWKRCQVRGFPSPHSGILFLCLPGSLWQCYLQFPSPHSGILFLLDIMKISSVIGKFIGFRPLIRGFFFYQMTQWLEVITPFPSFRPLIRGFFFYGHLYPHTMCASSLFPSPHSGILFLSAAGYRTISKFRVSVPSFGDSFFIKCKKGASGLQTWFPSPHSGILFLFDFTCAPMHTHS